MKKTHIIAIVCFAIAMGFYSAAGSEVLGGGFVIVGLIFEMIAWIKTFESTDQESERT